MLFSLYVVCPTDALAKVCMVHVNWQVSAARLSQHQFRPSVKGGKGWVVHEK